MSDLAEYLHLEAARLDRLLSIVIRQTENLGGQVPEVAPQLREATISLLNAQTVLKGVALKPRLSAPISICRCAGVAPTPGNKCPRCGQAY